MTLGEMEAQLLGVTEKAHVEFQLSDSGHDSVSASPDSDCPSTPDGNTERVPTVCIPNTLHQETIYKLAIQSTGGDSFDLQVSSAEMIQELHQVLLERDSTCHRTCFTLQLNGCPLDNFTEIRNIPDLTDGSVLQVVEEPYTVREARIHVRHVRELLRANDNVDSAGAVDGNSLSYLSTISLQERKDKDKSFDGHPPDYVLPGTKERSLSHLLPPIQKSPQALKNLAISYFNPPPGPRKMKGDVLYIIADTLEKRRLHITCCTKGFFVNSSNDDAFNAQPSNQHRAVYHSLVDLLSVVSPTFKKVYPLLIKKRSDRHVLDRLPTPYPVHFWVAPSAEVSEDAIRAEDLTQPHRVGFEDHLPGQIRDWNEELQTTHEMPRVTLTERVIRDRSIFKIHGDFVGAAVKGAMAVIDGNVMAINPADEPKTHMFIWNNIFFSLGFDVKDHYKDLGGDAAAFAATSADLQGVKAYSSLDDAKVCTLGMAIIDYRGFRVTAQSIIPGILDKEQEQSVVYGSVDFGKTVMSSEVYHRLLESSAKELKILPHEVLSGEDGKIARLYTSYETKGIIGNDGRHYVLDLLRTMPPDVHFLEDAGVSDRAKALGFPRSFPHKLASLRQELIEIFHEAKCMQFIKVAAQHIRQYLSENIEGKDADSLAQTENEVTRMLVEVSEGREPNADSDITKEAFAKAAEVVHSLQKHTFDIRFNPDCFSTSVKHSPNECIEKQKRLVIEAADFILTSQLPEFVQSCLDCSITPVDGEGLCELLHSRGINIRYLGEVFKMVVNSQSFIKSLTMCELIARSTKHVLKNYINNLPQDQLAPAISHLLNAVFGTVGHDTQSVYISDKNTKKNNRKMKKTSASGEWSAVTVKHIWKVICDDVHSYYGYEVKIDSADSLSEHFGVQKTSLLRRLCRTLGVQLINKDFQLDTVKLRTPFIEDDVQNVFPVLKHRQPYATDAKKLFIRGQQAMQTGHLRDAYECIAEAVNLMTSVYGAMHSELAQAMRMLARLSYILGDPTEALAQQHKATLMSERCNGLDHGYTIIEYINLAHFAFANLFISASLRLLYRARYLLLLAHGERHPLMAQIDGNIGVILFAVQEFDSALKFLQSAESGSVANGEPKRLKSALLRHMVARVHSSRGDFRSALAAEKETYAIYNNIFGADHEKTKESSECLKQLTQQAVSFQRKMMDASKGNSIAQLLPMQIQQPSLSSILDVLNILNGIIIISMTPSMVDFGTDSTETNSGTHKSVLTEEALD